MPQHTKSDNNIQKRSPTLLKEVGCVHVTREVNSTTSFIVNLTLDLLAETMHACNGSQWFRATFITAHHILLPLE
jgi:hypothetical protein